MRLIDADKLYRLLCNEQTSHRYFHNLDAREGLGKALEILDEQPTAYDVDRVISNIWDRSELIHIKHTHNDEIEDYIRTTDASEIVKAGGIDES